MGQEDENYAAERVWLEAYFDYCDDIELSVDVQMSMTNEGVTLPEILYVFKSPSVVWSERSREGCIFAVKGRNCDGEEITVIGGFVSEMQIVSVFEVRKERARK